MPIQGTVPSGVSPEREPLLRLPGRPANSAGRLVRRRHGDQARSIATTTGAAQQRGRRLACRNPRACAAICSTDSGETCCPGQARIEPPCDSAARSEGVCRWIPQAPTAWPTGAMGGDGDGVAVQQTKHSRSPRAMRLLPVLRTVAVRSPCTRSPRCLYISRVPPFAWLRPAIARSRLHWRPVWPRRQSRPASTYAPVSIVDHGSYITDTVNQRDWYKFSNEANTVGQSFLEAEAQFMPLGWSVAGLSQVQDLQEQFGWTVGHPVARPQRELRPDRCDGSVPRRHRHVLLFRRRHQLCPDQRHDVGWVLLRVLLHEKRDRQRDTRRSTKARAASTISTSATTSTETTMISSTIRTTPASAPG